MACRVLVRLVPERDTRVVFGDCGSSSDSSRKDAESFKFSVAKHAAGSGLMAQVAAKFSKMI